MNSNRLRGKRGLLLVKSRQKFKRTPLPSLILSNINRIFNKVDELYERIYEKNDYKFSQVLCFTETWLTEDHSDNFVKPPRFSIFRCDRYFKITGKDDGGGVCFLINNEWCTNVKILSKSCSTN